MVELLLTMFKQNHTVAAATGSTKDFVLWQQKKQAHIPSTLTFFTVAADLVGLLAEREGIVHRAPADDAD